MDKRLLIHLTTALVIFAQGLYFADQWLYALLFCLLAFTGIWLKADRILWTWSPLSFLLVINVALNLLGYFWYLEKGMLVFGVLQSLLYLMFFLIIRQIDKETRLYCQKAFVLWIAFAGILTAFAFMTGLLGELHLVIDGRASGPMQYANTFGILLLAALLLLMNMDMKTDQRLGIMVCLVVPMILTMSRAIYLTAIVLVVLMMVARKTSKATNLSLLSSLIVGAIVLYLFDDSTTAARLTEAAGASEWHSRLLYYKDATTMILDRPMGYGNNGYHYAQSFYQTGSTYHVKFVHSGLIQAFLDRGILAGVVMAIFMAHSVFLGCHSLASRLLAVAVLGHSLIDMNLQFPVVWLLLILVLIEDDQVKTYCPKIRHLILVPSGMVAIIGLYVLISATSFAQGRYRMAVNDYPYYTEAYRQLMKRDRNPDEVTDQAKALVAMNPYVTEAYMPLAKAAERDEDYEEALEWYEALVTYSPLLIEHHEARSHGLILAATYWYAYGDSRKALYAVDQILALPQELTKLAKERHTDYNVKHKPDLRMTPALIKDYEEASWLKKRLASDN